MNPIQEIIERGHYQIAHPVFEDMPTRGEMDDGWQTVYLGFENIVGDPAGESRKIGFSFAYNPRTIEVHEVEVFNENRAEMEGLMKQNEWVLLDTTRKRTIVAFRKLGS